MSLRAFHIIIVFATISLLLYMSFWNYDNWISLGESLSLMYVFSLLLLSIIVGLYGYKFYNKTRELNG